MRGRECAFEDIEVNGFVFDKIGVIRQTKVYEDLRPKKKLTFVPKKPVG
jgi:hypothetical protein